MNILFTGASSFTGCWFARALAGAGHSVWATFQRTAEGYDGIRAQRVRIVQQHCQPVWSCSFGSPAFMDLINGCEQWDLLCDHAADVTNYKSPDFDIAAALANNTRNLPAVLAALRERGCRRVLLTGSVFEQDEGAGSDGLAAFSPYGVSKGLTAQVFSYYTGRAGMRLGKFVIANPFGPYEEARFTTYLARTWLGGRTAVVKTPAYVRDNIHVSLLARAYSEFAQRLLEQAWLASESGGIAKFNPSGYIESQGAFAERFAVAMRPRLGLDCELNLAVQTDFPEPRIRINTDPLDPAALGCDQQAAWDEIAEWYLPRLERPR
jgi:UDP-glucose 4-epimerase